MMAPVTAPSLFVIVLIKPPLLVGAGGWPGFGLTVWPTAMTAKSQTDKMQAEISFIRICDWRLPIYDWRMTWVDFHEVLQRYRTWLYQPLQTVPPVPRHAGWGE